MRKIHLSSARTAERKWRLNRMDDYISREEALMALTGEWSESRDELISKAIRRIKSIPSADVRKNIEGEWFPLEECANEGIYCSNCHKKVFRIDYSNTMKKWKNFKYCPNCGSYNGGEHG